MTHENILLIILKMKVYFQITLKAHCKRVLCTFTCGYHQRYCVKMVEMLCCCATLVIAVYFHYHATLLLLFLTMTRIIHFVLVVFHFNTVVCRLNIFFICTYTVIVLKKTLYKCDMFHSILLL